jgi:tripartite-type tricarboxylate transporter receptor subunit TctC
MLRRHLLALPACGLLAGLTPIASLAQADRTLRILVGFPPGGSIDTVARLLADKMKDELKANIVVDNKPGAGGRVAADLLKAAPADGSTFMLAPVVVPVLAPLVFSTTTPPPTSPRWGTCATSASRCRCPPRCR